jgi:hypothetical protein
MPDRPLSMSSLQRVHTARELVLQAKRDLQDERNQAAARSDWYVDLSEALKLVDQLDAVLWDLRERARHQPAAGGE